MLYINIRFNNYSYLLVILLIIGCGNTLSNYENAIEFRNGNSTTITTDKFRLTKLDDAAQFDMLPSELANNKIQIEKFDLYLAQSPTQNSGGFIFLIIKNSNPLKVCLKKADSLSPTTAALTNPIALLRVRKETAVEMHLGYCHKE